MTPQDTVTSRKVLIVDENECIRELVREVLHHQFQVLCAASVNEAVDCVMREVPHVIILDLLLTGKDGVRGIVEIREVDPFAQIIMMVSDAPEITAQRMLHLGANGIVTKPFAALDLRNLVLGALRPRH